MVQIDLAGIINSITWWHLLWVVPAAFVWSFTVLIVEAFADGVTHLIFGPDKRKPTR